MSHSDIRIGTLVSMSAAVKHLPQLLPHGFERFSLTFWQALAAAVAAIYGQLLS